MKWSKDHRTGEMVTEKAYKPDNLRGKATIHLKDKNGHIIQEVESDNIILSQGHTTGHALYEMIYQSLMPETDFIQGTQYSSSTTSGFGAILLSDDSTMESEDNLYFKGSIIGWCPRLDQNPGTDITRGVHNPTESYVVYEDGYYHAHLVYDFGTSQGNGEFGSIWWTRAPFTTYRDNVTIPFKISRYSMRYRKHKIGIYGNHLRNVLGQICKVDSGNYFPLVNTKAALNGMESPEFTVNPATGAAAISNLWSYGNHTKRNSFDYTGFASGSQSASVLKAAKFDISDYPDLAGDPKQKTVELFNECPELADCYEKAFAQGRSSATLNNYSVFTDDQGVRWGYLYCATGHGGIKTFPTIDKEGNITPDSADTCYFLYAYDTKNMTWKIKPGLSYSSMYTVNVSSTLRSINVLDKKLLFDGTYLLTDGSALLYTFDVNKVTLAAWSYNHIYNGGDGTTGTPVNCYCFGPYDLIITNNSGWGFCITRAYCAHTKLPNKVTKTAADTMKIQYDYYIQIPYTFTDDGNYIPPLT